MQFIVVVIFTDSDGAQTNKRFSAQTLEQATKIFEQYSVNPQLIAFNMASQKAVSNAQQVAAAAQR